MPTKNSLIPLVHAAINVVETEGECESQYFGRIAFVDKRYTIRVEELPEFNVVEVLDDERCVLRAHAYDPTDIDVLLFELGDWQGLLADHEYHQLIDAQRTFERFPEHDYDE